MDTFKLLNPLFKSLENCILNKDPENFNSEEFTKGLEALSKAFIDMVKEIGDWEVGYKNLNKLMKEGIDVYVYMQEGVKPDTYKFQYTSVSADEIRDATSTTVYFKIAFLSDMSGALLTDIPQQTIRKIINQKLEENIWFADGMKRVSEVISKRMGSIDEEASASEFSCSREERRFLDDYKQLTGLIPTDTKYMPTKNGAVVLWDKAVEQSIAFLRNMRKAK